MELHDSTESVKLFLRCPLDQSKTDFLRLIAHAFRTPLNGLLGLTQLIWDNTQSEEADELRESFEVSRARILGILDNAILLTKIEVEAEKFLGQPVSLEAVLNAAIEQLAEFAGGRQVTVEPALTATPIILGTHDLLLTALKALLETAVKFSEPGGVVHCACDSSPEAVEITIRTTGRALPLPAILKFFDLFAIAEHETLVGHLGLGPAVAHRILALFGGSVTIANRHPPGIQITVSLKVSPYSTSCDMISGEGRETPGEVILR